MSGGGGGGSQLVLAVASWDRSRRLTMCSLHMQLSCEYSVGTADTYVLHIAENENENSPF